MYNLTKFYLFTKHISEDSHLQSIKTVDENN